MCVGYLFFYPNSTIEFKPFDSNEIQVTEVLSRVSDTSSIFNATKIVRGSGYAKALSKAANSEAPREGSLSHLGNFL